MPDRDGYIPGVPCWIDTSQPEPKKATEFYSGLFGWEFEDVMPEGAPGEYYIGRLGGRDAAAVGSIPEGMPDMALWNTYIWVDSADDTVSKAKDAGGSVLMEPFDVMESGRMGVFADPEGAAICAWQAKEHKGAQVVNEHGSLNFNNLNTRDVDGATKFYGAVFGWEVLNIGAEFWTLPGYGEYLFELNPDLKKQMEDFEGPEGFENVVGSIQPIPDDQPDTPPHWGVTFGTDDADASAAKAKELGGKVVVPPMDVPWSRMTVLTDPQGATFIASQFVLENKDLDPTQAGAEAA